MIPIIFDPEQNPVAAPVVLHRILKKDPGLLGQICDFGICADCKNCMDKLLTFPLGSAIVYFTCCSKCLDAMPNFIEEPERDEDLDGLEIASVEAYRNLRIENQ